MERIGREARGTHASLTSTALTSSHARAPRMQSDRKHHTHIDRQSPNSTAEALAVPHLLG
eukprot:868411-Alexandrium_andersonii.AAC.1